MKSKTAKILTAVMTTALVAGFGVSALAAEEEDPLSFADAEESVVNPLLDGEEISVTMYEDVYVANPNREEDQRISIYIPDNADKDSPIIFLVNNSGWQSDAYADREQVKTYGTEEQTDWDGNTNEVTVGDYTSTSDTDKIGMALSKGYVIVSYGCRSRSNGETDGEYLGHSPATMSDTKAAIRYLRYNADLLPAGDPEKIIVTGTSGGGALSTVIAASGNSSDYFEALYEVGAAGIDMDDDGNYVSTIGDDVYGVIAYCPITDLAGADMAYEWTYNGTREMLGTYTEDEMEVSGILADAYTDYLAGLDLTTETGDPLTTDNLEDCIIALMETEIEESIEEIGIEQMQEELDSYANDNDVTWITFNDDGTYTYDFDLHRYWLASHTTLKNPCAFSNYGMGGNMNEDSLFGSRDDEYSPFEFFSWEHDMIENNVGMDDTGLTWEEYMETEEGQALQLQLRMTSAVAYLAHPEDNDVAPNWYVRWGMADRDSSFGLETSLYYSMLDNDSIENMSFEFAWLKRHSGDYDVQEAYAWLESVL